MVVTSKAAESDSSVIEEVAWLQVCNNWGGDRRSRPRILIFCQVGAYGPFFSHLFRPSGAVTQCQCGQVLAHRRGARLGVCQISDGETPDVVPSATRPKFFPCTSPWSGMRDANEGDAGLGGPAGEHCVRWIPTLTPSSKQPLVFDRLGHSARAREPRTLLYVDRAGSESEKKLQSEPRKRFRSKVDLFAVSFSLVALLIGMWLKRQGKLTALAWSLRNWAHMTTCACKPFRGGPRANGDVGVSDDPRTGRPTGGPPLSRGGRL